MMRLFLSFTVVTVSAAFNPHSFVQVEYQGRAPQKRMVSNMKVNYAQLGSFESNRQKHHDESDLEDEEQHALISWKTMDQVCRGLFTSPIIAIVPIYSSLFGLLGPRPMWKFSSFIYKLSNGKDSFLFDHFARTKAVLSYRIHPLLASGALVNSGAFCFLSKEFVASHTSTLLVTNAVLSVTSSWFGGKLIPTMYGNASARKWTRIQQYLVAIYSTLALVCYYTAGTICHHQQLVLVFGVLNFSLLFCAGVLERLYVLCILSRFEITDRREYLRYYSRQFMWATITSIPLGIFLWLLL